MITKNSAERTRQLRKFADPISTAVRYCYIHAVVIHDISYYNLTDDVRIGSGRDATIEVSKRVDNYCSARII